jgi:flagellar basal-body rod protein FlgC
MNVISENLANIDTTKTEDGGPYRRKLVQVSNVQPPVGLADNFTEN